MTETLPATPPTCRLHLWNAVAWLPQWAVVLLAIVLLLAATAWGLLSPIIRERQAILRLQGYPGAMVYRQKSDACFPPAPTPWEQIIAGLTNGGQWSPERIQIFFSEETPTEALRDLTLLRRTDFVSLEGNRWSDRELAFAMQSLTINELVMTGTGITGNGWGVLQGQPIRELHIESGILGPEFLRAVRTMPHLEELTFEGPAITNEDLKSLSGHPTLNDLTLRETRVTSDCIETLATLPELAHLVIGGSEIDDRFLMELGRLGKLKAPSVWGTKITDAGLAAIPATVHLDRLSVSQTAITEAGLLSLRNVPTVLGFHGTNVRLTEPLKRWLLSHPFDSVSLDASMLAPASATAKELSEHIGYLHIQPAASPTDE